MTRRIYIEEVKRHVARGLRSDVAIMESERRDQESFWPRAAAMYLARRLTKRAFAEIGRRFGDRDHTTVREAIIRARSRCRSDREWAAKVYAIERQIRGEPAAPDPAPAPPPVSRPDLQLTFLHGPLFDPAHQGSLVHA